MSYLVPISTFLAWLFPAFSYAHCPLCTAGAAALAVSATFLGISDLAVGVLFGGASFSFSSYLGNRLKKRVRNGRIRALLVLLVYLSFVLPVLPFFKARIFWYLDLGGSPGTILSRVWVIPSFLVGSLVGAFLSFLGPVFSKTLSSFLKKRFPYQGVILTLLLLLFGALFFQLWLGT